MFILKKVIYLRERDGQRQREREREREKGVAEGQGERISSRFPVEHGARHGA